MGMCFAINTLSDKNINIVLEEPSLIWRIIAPDDSDIYLEQIQNDNSSFFTKLFKKNKESQSIEVPDFNFGIGEGLETDLDKSWHGIHYLLTQSEWEGEPPLNFIICGGEVAGDVDIGYGPGRLIFSKDVIEINNALKAIDHDYLKSRFNPEDMIKKNIYPDIWDRDPEEDDTLGYCIEYFDELKSFISEAAKNNMGLLVYLC